jgi:hypothetical protein
MFEEPETSNKEKDRSRLIITLSGIAVLLVIGLVVFVGSRSSARQNMAGMEMARPGAAEFDSYVQFVKMTGLERQTTSTLLGRKLGILKANFTNAGDKTLTGLRLRGVALGFGGEILAEKIVTPVPRLKEALGPGEVLPVTLQIDPIPDPGKIQEMTIEVYAVRVK